MTTLRSAQADTTPSSGAPVEDAAPATRSRRALLTTAAAAAAGAVASSLATAAPALGAINNPLLLDVSTNLSIVGTLVDASGVADSAEAFQIQAGAAHAIRGDSNSGIGIHGTSQSHNGVRGESDTYTGVHGESISGPGVSGKSTSGYGVKGTSNSSFGVYASSITDVAVYGTGGLKGVWGSFEGTPTAESFGVYGDGGVATGVGGSTNSEGKAGVSGVNTAAAAGGIGVLGESAGGPGVKGIGGSGAGVRAESGTGNALEVAGKASFSRSGRVSVAKNKSSVVVAVPGGVAAGSLCFANLAIYRSGVYVAAVRPNYPAGKMTIYLNKAVTASTAVAWIVFG